MGGTFANAEEAMVRIARKRVVLMYTRIFVQRCWFVRRQIHGGSEYALIEEVCC